MFGSLSCSHKKHSYEYRNTGRPSMKANWDGNDYSYDGFDMMSGGNGYDISHFAAASKWYVVGYSVLYFTKVHPTHTSPLFWNPSQYLIGFGTGLKTPLSYICNRKDQLLNARIVRALVPISWFYLTIKLYRQAQSARWEFTSQSLLKASSYIHCG